MKVDTFIKGGHVIDPYQGVDCVSNVAIKHGKVVKAEGEIEADIVIDASGKYVIPGMIDAHAHFLPSGNLLSHCEPVLSTIPIGITYAVDQGSAGVANYRIYLQRLNDSILKHKINLSFGDVGISGVGTVDGIYPTEIYNWKTWEGKIDLWQKAFEQYPDVLNGMKIRIPAKALNVDGQNQGMKALEEAVRICDILGKSLTVHVCEAPGPMTEVVSLLRSGDTMTHVFHGDDNNTILDSNGEIYPEIIEARNRGVWFDTAEDVGNHSLAVAKKAIEQGFWPDAISTDTTLYSIYRSNRVLLPHLMSKYYDWGMPLVDVIRCVTENPAKHFGVLGEVGTLSEGACGDAVIFEIREESTTFTDKFGNIEHGEHLFVPLCTVVEGNIVFRSMDYLADN